MEGKQWVEGKDEVDNTLMRKIFRVLNTFFMVPAFRLGLGGFIGTPFGGYMMVLKVIGWKSGKERYVPVNYAIENGDIFCLSGYGKEAHWYRNLLANPEAELLLPGRRVLMRFDDFTNAPNSLALLRQILKNSGFATFLEGINPFRVSDEKLRILTKDYCLLRFSGEIIAPGEADPGGRLWLIWPMLIFVLVLVGIMS